MTKFEEIKERYKNNYITEAQLDKYVTLNVITAAQATEISASKNQ